MCNKVVFTAMSKKRYYLKGHVAKFVFDQGKIPLNPFLCYDYFLLDTVTRDKIREANFELINRCDELWVFGEISDGVLKEIFFAKEKRIPIKYFKIIDEPLEFIEISEKEVKYEPGALELLRRWKNASEKAKTSRS